MISYYAYPGLKDTRLPGGRNGIIASRLRDKSPDIILKNVCEFYGLEENEVRSIKRKREYVWCRHVFFYLCHFYTSTTKTSIGKFIGRDHTTVIHGIQTVQDILDTDPAKVKELQEIEYMILFVPTVGRNK